MNCKHIHLPIYGWNYNRLPKLFSWNLCLSIVEYKNSIEKKSNLPWLHTNTYGVAPGKPQGWHAQFLNPNFMYNPAVLNIKLICKSIEKTNLTFRYISRLNEITEMPEWHSVSLGTEAGCHHLPPSCAQLDQMLTPQPQLSLQVTKNCLQEKVGTGGVELDWRTFKWSS